MSTYIIGDIQGCYRSLKLLLERIQFNAQYDELWLVGDLVNRGPQSLEVLQLLMDMPNLQVVLGNHDLHLLGAFHDIRPLQPNDTLAPILEHHEADAMLDWLRFKPLFYQDASRPWVMVHAGMYPLWTLSQHHRLANQVQSCLQSDQYKAFLPTLFGNEPYCWSQDLSLEQQRRFTVNALTRMRFCDDHACLNLSHKGKIGDQPSHLKPWFEIEPLYTTSVNVAFGHWAALEGRTGKPGYFALETGCVWGQQLTAYCLDDQRYYRVDYKEAEL